MFATRFVFLVSEEVSSTACPCLTNLALHGRYFYHARIISKHPSPLSPPAPLPRLVSPLLLTVCHSYFVFFLCQTSVVDRLPLWQTSLCMDDDREWIDTAREAPAVPADAALPTPDDLAYVVMR